MNSKYKVLVLDLDGTLFGKQPIKPELIESIREIYNKKIRVILCSGRTLYYVLGIARCLGIEDFVICEEGTLIYDPFKKKKIINGDLKNINKLRDNLESLLPMVKLPPEAHHDKQIILALDRKERIDLDDFVEEVADILNKNKLELNITRSDEMINVMPKNIDKGIGIEKVLNMTGYNKEEVLAMGDSYNDLPVFKKVGFSVAVANAHMELKKEADYVCEFENGKGVKEIIDKFF